MVVVCVGCNYSHSSTLGEAVEAGKDQISRAHSIHYLPRQHHLQQQVWWDTRATGNSSTNGWPLVWYIYAHTYSTMTPHACITFPMHRHAQHGKGPNFESTSSFSHTLWSDRITRWHRILNWRPSTDGSHCIRWVLLPADSLYDWKGGHQWGHWSYQSK